MFNLDSAILNICNNKYDYFLNKANVQGVGLSYKVINGYTTNTKCICVMVNNKIPKNFLSPSDLIPNFFDGIATDVIATGIFRTLSLTQRIRPVIGGYSIGPAGICSTGSYGGLVKDSNGLYVLSNNHVLAVENLVPIENPILQPSTEDGGTSPSDLIAHLNRFIPIHPITALYKPENFVDCAIAKLTKPNIASSYIALIGVPTGITTPILNTNLQAACSSSEYIIAPINAIGVTMTILFSNGKHYLFKNQIMLNHKGEDGDSGALGLTEDKKVVGLLFAGNDNTLLFNPIDSVLTSLGVTLVIDQ